MSRALRAFFDGMGLSANLFPAEPPRISAQPLSAYFDRVGNHLVTALHREGPVVLAEARQLELKFERN